MNNIYPNLGSHDYMPYTYIIGWRSLKVYYYGAEFGSLSKVANPKNLWTTYFTSSKLVKDYRSKYGEPDIIRIHKTFLNGEDAALFESNFLCRINAASRSNWLNMHNSNGNVQLIDSVVITDGTLEKSINQGEDIPEGWYKGFSTKRRQKMSKQIKKWHNRNGRDPEARSKSAPPKKKYGEQIIGKKAITNGTDQKFHNPALPLPDGYTYGRRPADIDKITTKITARKLSSEHKAKVGRPDNRIYHFRHQIHGDLFCTRQKLREMYGISKSGINHMISKKSRPCKGWSVIR